METLLGLTIGQAIGGIAGIILVLSIFIEVTPIKFNPLSALLKWIGKKVNGDVISKVDNLETKIDSVKNEMDETKALACRIRILRFGDEVRVGQLHSQEAWNQVMDDITNYKQYCDEHKDFLNEKAAVTTEIINTNYRECLENNNFL